MEGLNKLKTIADLLDGKGIILVRSEESKRTWFVNCWWNVGEGFQIIHKTYTDNLEKELDFIIEKLGGK